MMHSTLLAPAVLAALAGALPATPVSQIVPTGVSVSAAAQTFTEAASMLDRMETGTVEGGFIVGRAERSQHVSPPTGKPGPKKPKRDDMGATPFASDDDYIVVPRSNPTRVPAKPPKGDGPKKPKREDEEPTPLASAEDDVIVARSNPTRVPAKPPKGDGPKKPKREDEEPTPLATETAVLVARGGYKGGPIVTTRY